MTDVELRRNNFNQTSEMKDYLIFMKNVINLNLNHFGIADYNRSAFEMDVLSKQ